MSTSLALGFLFMAGGGATFSTSPQATAALVIALFPRFPHSPTDHRCHLQVCASCSCCRAKFYCEIICSRAEVEGAVLACQEGKLLCYSSSQAKLRVREKLSLHTQKVQQCACCKNQICLSAVTCRCWRDVSGCSRHIPCKNVPVLVVGAGIEPDCQSTFDQRIVSGQSGICCMHEPLQLT